MLLAFLECGFLQNSVNKVCSHVNDLGFGFCQACGEKNWQNQNSCQNEDYIVESRLNYLETMVNSSDYIKKKSALEKKFDQFIKECCGKNILTTFPEMLLAFLFQKMRRAKLKFMI